ncbi:UNVERIFIED_CONTAM: N-6 DNA methylase [Microbacterium sp. SLM126]
MPSIPTSPFPEAGIHRQDELIWVPLRNAWVNAEHLPEEVVRQDWVRRLHIEGGFALEQMDQERRTVHGRRSPRADIVVWASVGDREKGAAPVLVVETKAGEGAIRTADFWQGESYARAAGARFLVLANATTSLVYELATGVPGRARQINDWPRANMVGDNEKLRELVERLEVFDREQFQRVLFECHTLLRDNHAMTPDRAFDTISKVLFIKLHVERTHTHATFTTEYLNRAAGFLVDPKLSVHEQMFNQTKSAYAADDLFASDDRLDISPDTFRELVGKLERFNLSKTGEDIKGIAFERFLGRTFRGELGQYFTPRPVVDFMVSMLDPQEGEVICDPAAGSGGFLIRTFDYVRDAITEDVLRKRDEAIAAIEAEYAEDADDTQLDERDARVDKVVASITAELAPSDSDGKPTDTRVGRMAWQGIFGTDKEPRAARTAKMNMIMHGDGHGGIHWHDGLVDTHGVFAGRFDCVITNPPFGATVSVSQRIGATPETDVPDDAEYRRTNQAMHGDAWQLAHKRTLASRGKPILEQYEIGRGVKSRKTEQLFLERCIQLLRPGGRVGIVLPNGNLNASSQAWWRRWAEGRAFLRAVIALPPETFKFSGAAVTASILLLEKFTEDDSARWQKCWSEALTATEAAFALRRQTVLDEYLPRLLGSDDAQLADALGQLESLGIHRSVSPLQRVPQSTLVECAPKSVLRGPTWTGDAKGTDVSALKQAYTARLTQLPKVAEALREVRAAIKALDDEQTATMWSHVRRAFDYPVFMATPRAVGITATGDTGTAVANDLPAVLTAWHEFRAAEAS